METRVLAIISIILLSNMIVISQNQTGFMITAGPQIEKQIAENNDLIIGLEDIEAAEMELFKAKIGETEFNAESQGDNVIIKIVYRELLENNNNQWPIEIKILKESTVWSSIKLSLKSTIISRTKVQTEISKYFKDKSRNKLYKHYDKKSNLIIEDNIVHIFIDETHRFLTGVPTTAEQKYKYQLHVLLTNFESDYNFYSDGEYTPGKLKIYNSGASEEEVEASGTSGEEDKPINVYDLEFGIIGPFTDEFNIKLEVKANGEREFASVFDINIPVATLYHLSIASGFVISTLKNPQNISKAVLDNGDTTLIADEQGSRGILTLFAAFYPKGRSFLFPPSGDLFSEGRLGIILGTKIDKDLENNFFGGLQFDFARGGSINFGLHYGKRNILANNRQYKFGTDLYYAGLEKNLKSIWGISPFFGVNIDLRILQYFFKSGN